MAKEEEKDGEADELKAPFQAVARGISSGVNQFCLVTSLDIVP